MIALTNDKADGFVRKLQRKGIDVRWDGWNMIFHTIDPRARKNTNGRFSRKSSLWGFETIVSPNGDGKWLVDYKLARGKKIGT